MKIALIACMLIVFAITLTATKSGFNVNQVLTAKGPDYGGPN